MGQSLGRAVSLSSWSGNRSRGGRGASRTRRRLSECSNPALPVSLGASMKILFRLLLIVLLLLVAGSAVLVATSDFPAPVERIEKVIPNDRFTK